MALDKEKMRMALLLAAGLVLGVLSIFVPLKYVALLAALIGVIVFTFYFMEASFCLFIVFMSALPHQLWNNVLIMLAALFYLGVFYLQVLAGKRAPLPYKRVNIFLYFFVFFAAYSLFISNSVGDSLRVFMILFSCIILSIVLMGLITDKKTLNMVLSFICVGVFLTSLYGVYQKITGVEMRAEFIDFVVSANMPGRIFSTMDNPNNYAEYLTLLLPLCLAYFLTSRDEIKKFVILMVFGLGALMLVFTLSRGAYLTFAFGLALFILMVNSRLIPYGIILVLVIVPLMPNNFIINRLMTIGKDSSSSYRFLIWEGVLRMIQAYGLQGIGMGPSAFRKIYDIYSNDAAYNAWHSHNLILQMWVEMGIGGLISFLALMFTTIRSIFVEYFRTKEKYFKYILAGLVFSIVAIVLFSFAEYVWYYPRVMLTFWLVLGVSYGVVNLSRGGLN
ncbi:MAG: O-antigen ligase family protein [Clostridiales bacterium]|nr:O-antigen ligase family protein [Clostridiales bacterium]